MAFLGIQIPLEIGRLFKNLEFPGEKESSSEYHITILCFEENWAIENVSAALEATYKVVKDVKPFLVKTNKISSFPKFKDKPIPIILPIESKPLHDLKNKLSKSFDQNNIDFKKNFKDYKPHITLAYYDSNKQIKDITIDPVEFSVNEIVLWAGDHGDDRLFITFPLQAPEQEKRSTFLLQKAEMFCKIASNPPQPYLTSTHDRRKYDR